MSDSYYVVEFRFPVEVSGVETIEQAVSIASRRIEGEIGFRPDNWNARVFEYGNEIGPKVFFYNPAGTVARELSKNLQEHEELIKREEHEG